MKIHFRLILIACLLSMSTNEVWSQCGPPITTFPYTEGFETTQAWTSGGTSSDWAWGTPAHTTISSAGGGTKSWCIGGLTGMFYNYGELSWLMSPCFDFTSLTYPWISFKIFWEDEWKYDGLVLQSSLNGGTTWTNVGSYGDPINCLNDHWYDYNNITNLPSSTPKDGWTGRIGPTVGSCQGGNGSGGWVTAKHCMASLAGQPSVRFRFLFGAGTTCNSYDGMAIDDILIDNAEPNVANFTYSCGGSANVLNFTNTSTPCPTTYVWNFGDPASGGSNTSSTQNPNHTFSAPGTYTVTLTASGPCNASGTISLPVIILSVYTTVTNETCTGSHNGTATAHVTGGAGPFTYLWAPGGQTTQTITGLSAGTYTVAVTNSCPANTTAIVITNTTSSFTASIATVTLPTCFNSTNGAITTTVNGGTAPYSFLWNAGQTSPSIINIGAGYYCLTATDSIGCIDTACVLLPNPPPVIVIANGQVVCNGQSFSITANASNGIAPYTYDWNNGAFTGQTYNSALNSTTTYSVTATAANGCVSLPDTAVITVLPSLAVIVGSGATACQGHPVNLTATGSGGNGNYSYVWAPGNVTGNNVTVAPNSATTYTVTLTDGCTLTPAQDTLTVFIAPSPNVAFVADKLSGCSPQCIAFTDNSTVTSGSISSWHWAFGDSLTSNAVNPPLHCYPNAGVYTISLTVTSANGCTGSLTKNNYITVFPLPEAAFTSDPAVTDIYNPDISFLNNSTISSGTISTWLWTMGDNTSSSFINPFHIYENTGTYPVMLIVSSDKGCTDSIIHNIVINNGFTFYAPNSFTPNHDETNDTFLPKGTGWNAETYNLWIFDRWGNMCFYSTDMNQGWNGKANKGSDIALSDVYVWKVELSDTSGKPHRYVGIVSIVN